MKEIRDQYYYIKDASEMTGLSEQLIRKWENRYQIIQPERLSNGYRVYTHNDILVLKEIKKLRDEGYSIKEAVQGVLSKKEQKTEHYTNNVKQSPYVQDIIEKGANYDEEGIVILLNQANHQYGLDLFLQNTIKPFLVAIGDLWENEVWDESQETVASLVVKDFLTQISRNFESTNDQQHILGFCLPNEYHEIPLQILLLQMKIRGWRTTRIGASPKFSAIGQLVERMQPQKVVFSATTTIPFQRNGSLLEDLDDIAKTYPNISFYIGGKGVWDYTTIFKPKNMIISYSIEDIIK